MSRFLKHIGDKSWFTPCLSSINALKFDKVVPEHSKLTIGEVGEEFALRYLTKKRFKLVYRNWRCAVGELDLVMLDKNELVFVEVKTRTQKPNAKQMVFENITRRKKQKLVNLSGIYLKCFYANRPKPLHRIDLIGVVINTQRTRALDITHYRGAVGPDCVALW